MGMIYINTCCFIIPNQVLPSLLMGYMGNILFVGRVGRFFFNLKESVRIIYKDIILRRVSHRKIF
eukprot:snap_masked-scaffold_4-processed-gene-1.4-mRNA-1 protein AED:1.00 eAED:1.00 QI:0/0/0/0/1/1/2/0/64